MKKHTNRKWTWTLKLHRLIIQRHPHQNQHLREIKAKRRKIVLSIGKMTRQTHPQVMTLIHPRTVIIGVNDAKISNTGKRIQSDYAQL